MNVLLDEQEEEIRDAARDFLSAESPTSLVREVETARSGYSPELWKKMSKLGWIGISLPEEYGGQGLPLTFTGLLLSEIGRYIAPVPLHSTVVAALAISRFGTEEQKQQFLPKLASGESIGTFAYQERSGRIEASAIELQAVQEGDELVLNGSKYFVDNFAIADVCVVVARTGSSDSPRDNITVAIVDTKTPGIEATALLTTAKDNQSIVEFNNVRIPMGNVLGQLANGWDVATSLFNHAVALLCAQIVGATRRDMEFAVEYSKQRIAFGRPIGGFQSIQHLAADMLNATDAAELLAFEAIWRLGEGLPAGVEVSQAKAFASERSIFVCRSSQQIHGGIGFMAEVDLQLFYRRVVAWSLRLGSSLEHRRRIEKSILGGQGHIRLGETLELVE